jgi:hypothetical protein
VFCAGQKAQLVERRQVLFGLGHIVDHQPGLAHILMRAAVFGVDAQRFAVMFEHQRHVRVRALADRVRIEVVIVGVLRRAGQRLLQTRLRGRPVLFCDGSLRGRQHRIT